MKFKVPYIKISDIQQKQTDFTYDAFRQLIEIGELTPIVRLTGKGGICRKEDEDRFIYVAGISMEQANEAGQSIYDGRIYIYKKSTKESEVLLKYEISHYNERHEVPWIYFRGYFELQSDFMDDVAMVVFVRGDETRTPWVASFEDISDNLYITREDYLKVFVNKEVGNKTSEANKPDSREALNSGDWVRVKALLDELMELKKAKNGNYNQSSLTYELFDKYGYGFSEDSMKQFFAKANSKVKTLEERKKKREREKKYGKEV